MGKLSATGVQQAKGQAKPVKLQDGGGMYLLVNPKGTKYWRYNYRYANKRKTLALGVYPDTSLADARKAHQKARETLAKGIDPSEAKRLERITRHLASADSFEAVATEWYEAKLQGKSDSYRDRTRRLLKNDLYPSLGTRPISQITSAELLMVLRKVEAIVREEMNRAGGIELHLPVLHPVELWQQTGRTEAMGDVLLRLAGPEGDWRTQTVLGPTHEEVITEIARAHLKSYKQLPINLYASDRIR